MDHMQSLLWDWNFNLGLQTTITTIWITSKLCSHGSVKGPFLKAGKLIDIAYIEFSPSDNVRKGSL